MRSSAGAFFILLGTIIREYGSTAAATEATGKAANKKRGLGFLDRALQEAKRLGEAIDPEAVAEASKTWKDIAPELRKVAEDAMQAKDEFASLGKEAGGIWTDVQRAVSEAAEGVRADQDGSTELHWDALARDTANAAKGVFGEVVGDTTKDIVAAFENKLTQALSEGNLRAASELWHRLLDSPGAQLLLRDERLREAAQRVVRRHLQEFMSDDSAKEAERAVKATADYTLHFAGRRRNVDKSDFDVFEELSKRLCHLQVLYVSLASSLTVHYMFAPLSEAEKLWPLAERALPLIGYESYAAGLKSALGARAVARITQTVSASALLGLDPRKDAFLMTVIAAFALGHISQDAARNMAAFLEKAVRDPSIWDRKLPAPEGAAKRINPTDLAAELVSGTSTCAELGRQSFQFFEAVKRALEVPSAVNNEDDRFSEGHTPDPWTSQTSSRPARRLALDGIVVQQALWMAAVVDQPWFSPDICLLCLGIFAVMSGILLGVCCCRRPRQSRDHRQRGRPAKRGAREKTA